MAREARGFGSPKETRTSTLGKLKLVELRGGLVGRGTFEPRWSEDMKRVAGTASCQASHTGYVISGACTLR